MAEASAAEACFYFSTMYPVEIASKNQIALEDLPILNFTSAQVDLGRYETLISEEISLKHGVSRDDGQSVATGVHSYRIICRVDIIDRRVLSVAFANASQWTALL